MPSREGFGQGRIDRRYTGVNDGIPLLSSFYFRYEKAGSSEAIDNDFNSIRVLPAGRAVDLSPNAGLPMETVESGKISLMYRDKDADDAEDRYFYKVSHFVDRFSPTFPTAARRYQIRDVGCVGTCERVLPRPPSAEAGIFVLVGFQIFMTGGRDNRVDRLSIMEEDGKLVVRFNWADTYGYIVDYALWKPNPRSATVIRQGESGNLSGGPFPRGGTRVSLPRGQKVLQGFFLRFGPGTGFYPLREIGVLTTDARLEVYLSDRSGDLPIWWGVKWAAIQPEVSPATESPAVVAALGST